MIKDFKSLTPTQRVLCRELYKRSFYEFARDFWCEIDPQPFIDGFVVKFFCETFQYFMRPWIGFSGSEKEPKLPKPSDKIEIIDVREDKHNLCLSIPPRHSKSNIMNILGGVWAWLNAPIKLASVSHTQQLAGVMNAKRQKLLNSERFKYFFPEIQLTQNSTFSLKDNRGGELYSINRNALTGYGFDLGLMDDLTNAEQVRKSKEEMNNAWQFFQNTLPSRINDQNKYVIINIQQRLGVGDICGRIMADAKLSSTYTFVSIPAIFDKHTYIVCPISGDVYEFRAGDPLWPERFGDYSNLRAQVGETVFQTQYLQKPVNSEASVIKEEMINEAMITEVPKLEEADMVFASHDFPVKDKDSSDYLGSILAYRVKGTLYIKDCLEKKMAFVSSVNYVKALEDNYPGIVQVIEDKANGSPLLQQLHDEISGLQPYSPGSNSKYQRLEQCTWYLGNVVLVKDVFNPLTQSYELSESIQNLKNRLLAFPFVEHDDIVDAFSMLILYVFLDKRNCVYGRSFNDQNVVNVKAYPIDYSNVFFTKDGDTWKVVEIGIKYGEISKLYAIREDEFRANIGDGIKKLHEFSPKTTMFVDCSPADSLIGIFDNNVVIEHYDDNDDFERSVSTMSVAFASNKVLIDQSCKLTKIDIDNFKYNKNSNDQSKFRTTKDGLVGCLRTAIKYFGGL